MLLMLACDLFVLVPGHPMPVADRQLIFYDIGVLLTENPPKPGHKLPILAGYRRAEDMKQTAIADEPKK